MNIWYSAIFTILFLEGICSQGLIRSFFFPIFEDASKNWNSQSESTDTEISQNYNDDGESVYVSKTVEQLPDGNKKITKTSEFESTDKLTGKIIKKKKVVDYLQFPNGTVVEMSKEHEGSGLLDSSGSGVECVADDDCSRNTFCDRSRFACRACFKQGITCRRSRECCEGFKCNGEKCKKIIGEADDPCESDKDCLDGHCCTSVFGEITCQRYRDEGEECGNSDRFYSPKIFSMSRMSNSNMPMRCPCKSGLKCIKKRSFFMLEPKVCQNATKSRRQNHLRRKRQMRSPRKRQMASSTDTFFDAISRMIKGITSFAEDSEDY